MTALTFADALAKYRSDQARDNRGRFTDEGKGRGRGATEAMAGTAKELDHLLVTRYKRKPAAAAAALRAELARQGVKVPAFKGGNRQLFREWLLGAVQLAGRETIMNAGLNTRPRSKFDQLDEARSRALDRGSEPSQLKDELRRHMGSTASEVQFEHAFDRLKGLPRAKVVEVANGLLHYPIAVSSSKAAALDAIRSLHRAGLGFDRHQRATRGRTAG